MDEQALREVIAARLADGGCWDEVEMLASLDRAALRRLDRFDVHPIALAEEVIAEFDIVWAERPPQADDRTLPHERPGPG